MFRLIQLLLTLLVAISLIRSVVRAFHRMFSAPAQQTPMARESQTQPGTHAVLVQDPVCGTYVSVDSSLKRIIKGHVVHFCSEECRDRYAA